MKTIEYVHHGDNNIRCLKINSIEDCEKLEWSFDDWKTTHCGIQSTLDLVLQAVRNYGTIINIYDDIEVEMIVE